MVKYVVNKVSGDGLSNKFITTMELSRRLGVSSEAIRLWVKEGCPVEVEKKPRLFTYEKVIRWLNFERGRSRKA